MFSSKKSSRHIYFPPPPATTKSLLQWFLHQVPAQQTHGFSSSQLWAYLASLKQYHVQVIQQPPPYFYGSQYSGHCFRYLNNTPLVPPPGILRTNAFTSSRYLYNTPPLRPPGISRGCSTNSLVIS